MFTLVYRLLAVWLPSGRAQGWQSILFIYKFERKTLAGWSSLCNDMDLPVSPPGVPHFRLHMASLNELLESPDLQFV